MCLCHGEPKRSLNPSQSETLIGALRIRSLRWTCGRSWLFLRNCRALDIALETQDDSNGFLVLDDLRVTFCEVARILEQRPVAAEHVDQRQDNFITRVVENEHFPINALFLLSEVDLVENQYVHDVHNDGGTQENTRETGAHDEGNGEIERSEKVDESFVHLETKLVDAWYKISG